MRPLRIVTLVFGVVAAAALPGDGAGAVEAERRATIFYTGAVHGVLEPCGCTSDPLGDIARMTGLVRRAQADKAAVLVVDAGNLLYPPGDVPEAKRPAADLRAAFLASEISKLPFGGAALGEADLAGGFDKIRPKRLAANLEPAPFVEPSRLMVVGGIKMGVMGLIDPQTSEKFGKKAQDPVTAAQQEATRLRTAGAEIVILVAALERAEARKIGRAAAIDFIIVGRDVGAGMKRPDAVGNTFILAPGAELERVGRIDIVMRGARRDTAVPALLDAGGPQAMIARRQEVAFVVANLDKDLARWASDPSSNLAFVAAKKRERDDMASEAARLASGSWQAPVTGSYFTNQLIPLTRALPRDPRIGSALRGLDRAVGKANLGRATPPPAAESGRAAYVGDGTCARCHKAATAFWKTTVHAQAWKTLVVAGKAADYDCVSCHVTGFGEVGGSSLGFTKALTNVQCETCHGPGSLHVAARGLDEPPTVHAATPKDTCLRCHTEKHSDTFDYQAYLRDVLGPGHGADARKKLGPGPTGRQLRSAALARAAGKM